METFLDIVQDWYDQNEGDFSFNNSYYYLTELFQDLKRAGLNKENLVQVGERILFLLDIDMADESIRMIHQRMLAEEINLSFRVVNKEIEEVKDEPMQIEKIKEVTDGDVYLNNTNYPDIDLRGVDWEQIPDDETFLRELGIKNER